MGRSPGAPVATPTANVTRRVVAPPTSGARSMTTGALVTASSGCAAPAAVTPASRRQTPSGLTRPVRGCRDWRFRPSPGSRLGRAGGQDLALPGSPGLLDQYAH